MIKSGAGRRYARAVFELAAEKGDFDRWSQSLGEIRSFLNDARIASVIQNPEVPIDKKKSLIDAGLMDLDSNSRNFVYLLVQRRRSQSIDGIIAEYERLLNEHRGIAIAEVVTAVPLDDRGVEMVAKRLSALTGKQVSIRCSVDADIIGGIVARVGDRLINGSVSDRLERMREKLVQA